MILDVRSSSGTPLAFMTFQALKSRSCERKNAMYTTAVLGSADTNNILDLNSLI